MAPLLPGCYAPSDNVENERAMVAKRITELRKPPDALDEKNTRYAQEFTALLRTDVGEVTPHDYEQVNEQMGRPAQRRITEEASYLDVVPDTIKSFMKKEAYQKIGDPRPIATINGKVKFEYSQYTHAVAEVLKRTHWYAFGKRPKRIAETVVKICMAAQRSVTNTDLSRFDGRVNKSARMFEEMVMMALFDPKHHKHLLLLMKKQYGQKGVGRHGTKYLNGFNRQSGSPETAILNTVLNVFMAYVCLRESGLGPDEAYAKLGIYGGDDGMTPDVDPQLYTATCAIFGQVLEAEEVIRGSFGVTFLARYYSRYVWTGCADSCADIARAASKVHVSTNADMTPLEKLYEKAYALSLTDSNTPIIGPFVRKAVVLSGKRPDEYKNRLRIWNSDISPDQQYPNENHDDWMYELLETQRLTGYDTEGLQEYLDDCKSMGQLLTLPEFADPVETACVKDPVQLNGELLRSKAELEKAIQAYEVAEEKSKSARDAARINPAKPQHTHTHVNSNIRATNVPPTTTTVTTTTTMSPVPPTAPTVSPLPNTGVVQLSVPVIPRGPLTLRNNPGPVTTLASGGLPTGGATVGSDGRTVGLRAGDGPTEGVERDRPCARDVGPKPNARPSGNVNGGGRTSRAGRDVAKVYRPKSAGRKLDQGPMVGTTGAGKDVAGREERVQGERTPPSGGNADAAVSSSSSHGTGKCAPTCTCAAYCSPAPRLVGIETNPGPAQAPPQAHVRPAENAAIQMAADGLNSMLEAAAPTFEKWRQDYPGLSSKDFQGKDNPFIKVWAAWEDKVEKPILRSLEPVLDYIKPKPKVYQIPPREPPKHKVASVPARTQQINGNNGSHTNTDDHAAKLGKMRLMQTNAPQGQKKKKPNGGGKRAARKGAVLPMVAAPAAASRANRTREPRFARRSKDSMTIEHSEMVAVVNGTAAFTATTLAMQPGDVTVFPWLASQSIGWEKYRWDYLTVRYETRTGTNVPGSLMLVADYDPADGPPTSEVAASTYHGTVDDAPWKENILRMDMRRSKELFLRFGPLAANLDIKTYDFAKLFICTADGTAVNWGKVFIDYKITLINTQVLQANLNAGGSIYSDFAGQTPANIYGTAPTVANGSLINTVNVGGVGRIFLTGLLVGAEYVITTLVAGTGLTTVNTVIGAGLNLKTSVANDLVNAAGTLVIDYQTFTAAAPTAYLTITATGTTVNPGGAFTTICAIATNTL
jgi:hypothetical protein